MIFLRGIKLSDSRQNFFFQRPPLSLAPNFPIKTVHSQDHSSISDASWREYLRYRPTMTKSSFHCFKAIHVQNSFQISRATGKYWQWILSRLFEGGTEISDFLSSEGNRAKSFYLSDCVDYFFRDKFDKILKQHFKMSLATFSFQSSQRNTCSYTTCTFTMFVFFFRNEQSNKQKRLATRYRVPLSLKKHTQVIQDHTSLSIRVFALRNSEEKNNCCRILLD